jgi:glycosyltransferase involved in cell wall biosynthesis
MIKDGKPSIAVIGTKGIPARCGGFETAVDYISRGLVQRGHEVLVYNRPSDVPSRKKEYEGVRLTYLPTLPSKNLSTIMHSFLSSLHVLFTRTHVVHYYTTGAILFAPLPRLFGKKIVCSVDGSDWQRKKWGRFARAYLRLSERLAVWFSNELISDSREVQRYYLERYCAKSQFVPYGMRERTSWGKEWLSRLQIEERKYVLFVGRLRPDNNIHSLIRAFQQVPCDLKLVIVGDDPWEKEYIRELKSTRDPRINFTGAIYGEGYEQLQSNAYLFVLPDEVGGTHPALVEAMGFGNCVLVNDTPSNLEVIDDAGFSFKGTEGAKDLASQLRKLIANPSLVEEARKRASERAHIYYRWDSVVEAHEKLYAELVTGAYAGRQGRGEKI